MNKLVYTKYIELFNHFYLYGKNTQKKSVIQKCLYTFRVIQVSVTCKIDESLCFHCESTASRFARSQPEM